MIIKLFILIHLFLLPMNKELDEKKLSPYSLALAMEVKKTLPYIKNMNRLKSVAKALEEYMNAYIKLGGKL